jgi:ketosteroid isomerase-like protein
MSQENVEIVRRFIARYNAGDLPWDLLDPEVEWVLDPPAWLAGTYRGHDGVGTLLSGMAEAFDEVRLEVDRYLDAGDVVVTLGRMEVRVGLSGVTTGQPLAQVIWVRDGRVVAVRGNCRPMRRSKPPGCETRRARRRTPIARQWRPSCAGTT